MIEQDILIIGGGPAGLAAAIAAKEQGIENILIIEREEALGGALNQCIHTGFGHKSMNEALSGPEYAQMMIDRIEDLGIKYKLGAVAIDLSKDKEVKIVSGEGITHYKAKAIILAMGCREKPRGAINIPGSKVAGIITVGTAQKFVDLEGYMPGKQVVILGSGNIGLVMARRMTIEGANVKAVVELRDYPSGSRKNIKECLTDFNIPIKLSHTVVDIKGKDRVEGVTIAKVDDNKIPIFGTEEFISCDTLLLSVDLLPENELSRKAGIIISNSSKGPEVDESMQTNIEGIFACGNVLHLHDYVDNVADESYHAGMSAALFVLGRRFNKGKLKVIGESGISYIVPKFVNPENMSDYIDIKFRVDKFYYDKKISIYFDDNLELSLIKNEVIPNEMEYISISKDIFEKNSHCGKMIIKLEDIN